MAVRRLNHAVLYVNGLAREVEFYTKTLGFEVRMEVPGRAAFLRSPGSANDHDLGLFDIGTGHADGHPKVGLYHLAWEVGTLAELVETREKLLEAGALVGVLADRTLADEPVLRLPFLEAPAPFPTGPMRMAAALRTRVLFMAGLYRGGNRYEIHFEPLADFTAIEHLTRAERDARVHEAVAAYVRRLEHHCRATPDNFFNFYDFWK